MSLQKAIIDLSPNSDSMILKLSPKRRGQPLYMCKIHI